jgi:hypothetical protein
MRKIAKLQSSFARIFTQRCFYLFISLLTLMAAGPFVQGTVEGRLLLGATHVLVLISAVAAVGRTPTPFVIALLLAIPAFGFQFLALQELDDPVHGTMVSASFYLAFYVVAIGYLLRYVFNPEVMDDDKLFGAASAFVMLAVAWAIAYSLVQRLDPVAFGVRPGEPLRSFYDLLFMSVGYLTSNGPGDIVLVGAKVRALAILEQLFGTLFLAILIARLAGIYPARGDRGE